MQLTLQLLEVEVVVLEVPAQVIRVLAEVQVVWQQVLFLY
jgi:hypothetical protein